MSNQKQAGKMILYIACTLDGYIAGENDDLSFLSSVEKPGEDYGYADFMKNIDTVIMGRKTLDWITKNAPDFTYADKETYIISRKLESIQESNYLNISNSDMNQKDADGNKNLPPSYKIYSGNLKSLGERLLSENKRIFLIGGAEIILQMLDFKLVDEFYIAIIPVLLGNGTPLFKPGFPKHLLMLDDVRNYDTGVVMLHYKTVRE